MVKWENNVCFCWLWCCPQLWIHFNQHEEMRWNFSDVVLQSTLFTNEHVELRAHTTRIYPVDAIHASRIYEWDACDVNDYNPHRKWLRIHTYIHTLSVCCILASVPVPLPMPMLYHSNSLMYAVFSIVYLLYFQFSFRLCAVQMWRQIEINHINKR